MSSDVERDFVPEIDSEDELDWEEVDVPEPEPQHLEITIHKQLSTKREEITKKKGISHADRLLRIDCHKIHTIVLLGNASVRNKWINDPLLHARLLSLTPLPLQTAFSLIHKSRQPDPNQRGRMFEAAMRMLTEWWSTKFFEVIPEGHIRNRTFDEIQTKLERYLDDIHQPLDVETLQDINGEEGERIRGPKSLMKHALMRSGSRDVSSQLFTSLCRALGIPARLVVSLQSVPWQAGVGKPKPRYERKRKAKVPADDGAGKDQGDNDDTTEVINVDSSEFISDVKGKGKAVIFTGTGQRLDDGSIPPKSEKAKGKEKAKPVIKLRKQRDMGHLLGSDSLSGSASSSRLASPDPTTFPPVFWVEVFSRPDARWLPVDPIRGIVNKRKLFDPTPPPANTGAAPSIYPPGNTKKTYVPRRVKEENRMVYVMAFEEDGYARDVTRRYAREYSAKVAKVQGGSGAANTGRGGKVRQAWWERVTGTVKRPYRLHRDDLEDEELEAAQMMEGMPTTISGFKDHPLYALLRHLKQTETIHPPPPDTPELGKFRGESVYPRSSVVPLKTAENWMRSEGRMIKAGCQSLKMVKARAGTVNRMRELEVLKDELRDTGHTDASGSGAILQGLYARFQTEQYVPDPIVDGKIPKNTFGNIDLYVPSMLPKGGVHIPFKGTAKIARKLGFDFAEAVTGFEFKKRRAFPIIEGVVVSIEHELALLEAYWAAEKEAEEKVRAKKEDRVVKQWIRLVQGLRIRQRLQKQYASKPSESAHQPKDDVLQDDSRSAPTPDSYSHEAETSIAGGFLAGADEVVQAFHLPKYTKYTHATLPSTPPPDGPSTSTAAEQDPHDARSDGTVDFITYDLETMDVDPEMDEEPHVSWNHAPKTMQELVEDAARQRQDLRSDDGGDDLHHGNNDGLQCQPSSPQVRDDNGSLALAPSPQKRGTAASNNRQTKKGPAKRRRGLPGDEDSDTDYNAEEGNRSARKRPRAKAVPAAALTPTRVLRPRVSKTKV